MPRRYLKIKLSTPLAGGALLISASKAAEKPTKLEGTALGVVWLLLPYLYGILVWMKKTMHIDEKLLQDAKLASGASTDTETVRLGLEALIRRAAYERLRALRGSEPNAIDVPRRRENPARQRNSE